MACRVRELVYDRRRSKLKIDALEEETKDLVNILVLVLIICLERSSLYVAKEK